jgi:hypothetical protein
MEKLATFMRLDWSGMIAARDTAHAKETTESTAGMNGVAEDRKALRD